MANEINIDSLSIEIKSNASSAVSSLYNLSRALEKLKTVTTGLKGLTRIANQIKLISDATANINVTGLDKLTKLTTNIEAMSKLPVPNFSKTANSLNSLSKSLMSINNISDLKQFSNNIKQVAKAVKPLETLGKNTLAPFISTFKALPKVVESLDTSTLERFRDIINSVVVSIQPLADSVTKSEKGLSALNGILQATTRQNGANAQSNAALVKSYTALGSIFTSVKVKLLAYYMVARRVGRILGDAFAESNRYVENLNLFTVAMGEAADEAYRFAQEVNDALGIDPSTWMRYQGFFKQVLTGFGSVTEKANLMSKNLTQISYDISSFFNIDIEEAYNKVQSGISGELEPLIVAA